MRREDDVGGMCAVYCWCGQYGQCMVHTLAGVAGAAGAWFIRTLLECNIHCGPESEPFSFL